MKNNRILIFGVSGQDGSYLAELLLSKNYEVHGVLRKASTNNKQNIQHLIDDEKVFNKTFFIHQGDLVDKTSIYRIISEINPSQIFNEADQDHVTWSTSIPDYSLKVTVSGALGIFEAVKVLNSEIKIFQPISSNIFGKTSGFLQDENTPVNPVSPYGIAKATIFQFSKYYREYFGLKINTGIFYNHESPRRTSEYVTRKISIAAAKIKLNLQKELYLGDLNSKVDWGFAPEYMEIAHKIMNHDTVDDYIICTGKLFSVGDFAKFCFEHMDLEYKKYVKTSEHLMRKNTTSNLSGDNSKLKQKIDAVPVIYAPEIAKRMVESDFQLYDR